jgi:hypothetical protein
MRAITTLMLLAMMAVGASTASAQRATITGRGAVRVCDADGQNIDSDGDQYDAEGNGFIAGPPAGFQDSYSCNGDPQTFRLFTTADPDGDQLLGYRVVTQATINVTAEPEFTSVEGTANMSERLCFGGQGALPPTVTVLARAKASRSIAQDCMDELGREVNVGACSTVRGRFNGIGQTGFLDAEGRRIDLGELIDLAAPVARKWTERGQMSRSGQSFWYIEAGLSATMISKVAEAPRGTAFGDLRFYVEIDKNTTAKIDCLLPLNATAPDTNEILPFPRWMVDAGDAIPDDFTLAVSPPTSRITTRQQFDLSIMAATGGAVPTAIRGNINGLDVSGPLAGCLQPTAALRGVQGLILTCRGLSGGFLAGIFGIGAHTLSVSMTLSDGRVISDSATWTIRP